MKNTKNSSLAKLFPVMLCFFAMGFVDLVGIASNYVKADLNLTDSQANIFPSLVFFWFLIFSVPTGMLMNRIGRKKTVLLRRKRKRDALPPSGSASPCWASRLSFSASWASCAMWALM